MEAKDYLLIKAQLIIDGYEDEINWQRDLKPCDSSESFRDEIVWVILNSGMREQICRMIAKRIKEARAADKDISTAFNHVGKVNAIKFMFANYKRLFNEYQAATDKITYLQTIPFLGTITKYHAAKSLGFDCIKPDRHLVRIAKEHGFSDCNYMCNVLSEQTGDKVSVIDIVLWRAANLGFI